MLDVSNCVAVAANPAVSTVQLPMVRAESARLPAAAAEPFTARTSVWPPVPVTAGEPPPVSFTTDWPIIDVPGRPASVNAGVFVSQREPTPVTVTATPAWPTSITVGASVIVGRLTATVAVGFVPRDGETDPASVAV